MTQIKLNNGTSIPAIGLGTFRSQKDDAYKSVRHALEVGYRHIDTAEAYGNEEQVGRAIIDSGVDRSEVFVTTKLWNEHWTTESAAKALDGSLQRLQSDYVDLYLVHWAGPYDRIRAVWRALEDAADAGKAKAIGVSNFQVHHINMLLESSRITPVANQVECHPHLQNHFLAAQCAEHDMVLESYAPLNSDHIRDLLEDDTLKGIAQTHGRTVAQIVIRWHIQRGYVALPKSITPSRIEENFQVFDFELSDQEMGRIRRLNRAARHFPDPDNADFGFPVK